MSTKTVSDMEIIDPPKRKASAGPSIVGAHSEAINRPSVGDLSSKKLMLVGSKKPAASMPARGAGGITVGVQSSGGASEEVVHDKCGTSECCNKCDTATKGNGKMNIKKVLEKAKSKANKQMNEAESRSEYDANRYMTAKKNTSAGPMSYFDYVEKKSREKSSQNKPQKPSIKKEENEQVNEDHVKVGDKVHAGLAQKGGAGHKGTVHKIEGDHVYVKVSSGKYGDRIVKAHHSKVTKEEAEQVEEGRVLDALGAAKDQLAHSLVTRHVAKKYAKQGAPALANYQKDLSAKKSANDAYFAAKRAIKKSKRVKPEHLANLEKLKSVRNAAEKKRSDSYGKFNAIKTKGDSEIRSHNKTYDNYGLTGLAVKAAANAIKRKFAKEEAEQIDEVVAAPPKKMTVTGKDGATHTITHGKYGGDDRASHAIFVNGRPAVTGLERRELSYHHKNIVRKLQEAEQVDEVAKWRTDPAAHTLDTDGTMLPKTFGAHDALAQRQTYLSGAKTYIKKSVKNPKNARKKLQSYAKSAIKMYREEAEQMNELKKSTLASYANKVSADSQKHKMDPTKRSAEKASRSVAGYAKALKKLAKEEAEQVDEALETSQENLAPFSHELDSDMKRINYQFDKVFCHKFSNPHLIVTAVAAILERFSINCPVLNPSGKSEVFILHVHSQTVNAYVYIGIERDAKGHYDAIVQIVDESGLALMQSAHDALKERPELPDYPTHWILQQRHTGNI